MKITKNGSDKNFEIMCYNCKSDFIYNLSDVVNLEEDHYDDDGHKYKKNVKRIICPVCNTKLLPNYKEVVNESKSN